MKKTALLFSVLFASFQVFAADPSRLALSCKKTFFNIDGFVVGTPEQQKKTLRRDDDGMYGAVLNFNLAKDRSIQLSYVHNDAGDINKYFGRINMTHTWQGNSFSSTSHVQENTEWLARQSCKGGDWCPAGSYQLQVYCFVESAAE